jgi:hypothetical protein
MKTQTLDDLYKVVLHAMEKETQRIVEEEAKNAAERVEERVRAQAGQIATKVATYVSCQPRFNELIITVRLPEREESYLRPSTKTDETTVWKRGDEQHRYGCAK